MPHPNVELIRAAYTALANRDVEAYWRSCADDFTFHMPGHNLLTGTYTGREAWFALVGKVRELTGGTFREEVREVLADDTHGVILSIHRFERSGAAKEYRTVHIYHFRDGRLIEGWELPRDPSVFDDAWS